MPGYTSLSPEDRTGLLRDIIDRCARRGTRGPAVVVFDLDGTLMDNRPRSAAILRELADRWADARPHASKALAGARAEELVYLFSESLGKLGVTDPVLVKEAVEFWRERFFVDDYLKHDVEVPGAREFANAVHEAGATIVYLTGRDLPLMGLGSFASLRDLGFPIGVAGTELVLKPDAKMPDERFKAEVAPSLARIGEVVAAFDNEPGNCNVMLERFPRAASVLLDTQHFPNAPRPAPGVAIITDFTMLR